MIVDLLPSESWENLNSGRKQNHRLNFVPNFDAKSVGNGSKLAFSAETELWNILQRFRTSLTFLEWSVLEFYLPPNLQQYVAYAVIFRSHAGLNVQLSTPTAVVVIFYSRVFHVPLNLNIFSQKHIFAT